MKSGCQMHMVRPTRGLCGKPGDWQHPRWPGDVFCGHHKAVLALFFKTDWSQLAPSQTVEINK